MSDNANENCVHPEFLLLFKPGDPLVSTSLCCRRCAMASRTSPPPWPLTPCRRSWLSAPGQAAYGCILQTRMWFTPPLHLPLPLHLIFLPSLHPSHWRHCGVAQTSCAAFEMFLHQKLGSPQNVTNLLLCCSFPFHPSGVIDISTCQVFMLHTQS